MITSSLGWFGNVAENYKGVMWAFGFKGWCGEYVWWYAYQVPHFFEVIQCYYL